MDLPHLKSRGWAPAELAHAGGIMEKADAAKHPHVRASEHAHLWMLVMAIGSASACFSTLLFPLLLFGPRSFGMLLMALAGAGVGLMYTHALRSLRVPRAHHLSGLIVIALISLLSAILVVSALQDRFAIVPGAQQGGAMLFALALTLGLTVPYALDRRLHGHNSLNTGGFNGSP